MLLFCLYITQSAKKIKLFFLTKIHAEGEKKCSIFFMVFFGVHKQVVLVVKVDELGAKTSPSEMRGKRKNGEKYFYSFILVILMLCCMHCICIFIFGGGNKSKFEVACMTLVFFFFCCWNWL